MDVLYKYTKHITSFFKNPTIKLSVPSFLNDPFESDVADEFSSRMPAEEPWLSEIGCYEALEKLGIVSFSETSRNLLMWAHYADEHRGMCIGFDPEVLNSANKYQFENESYKYYPVKVNYDNIRVDVDDLPQDLSHEVVATKILTTKSDDWIYEKEHRCIVPIGWSDHAYLIKENERAEQAIKNIGGNINKTTKEITISKHRNKLFEHITHYKDVLFLKKINPRMVKSIHFGYRFSLGDIAQIVNDLQDPTHPLHHIKAYRYKPNKYRFELEPKIIYSDGKSYLKNVYTDNIPHTTDRR